MKILIAEDDPVSRRLLEVTLRKMGYDVVVCADGVEAWKALQQPEAPQLAILDWMMPGMDGLEVCHHVRKRDKQEPYIYIVMLTARGQKSDVIAGLEKGADDYLVKPFDTHELRVRLRAGQRIVTLLDEVAFAREQLREQARQDSLTRLCNRAAICDFLDKELSRAQRSEGKGALVSIILADLDHFKDINDTFGHLAGDTVLREVARRMREAARPYDGIGRFGGEEFLLVLPGCDTPGAVAFAGRLCQAVGSNAVVLPEGPVHVTLSAGIATTEQVLQGANCLIGAADIALYRAKHNGRNRVELATAADLITSEALLPKSSGEAIATLPSPHTP